MDGFDLLGAFSLSALRAPLRPQTPTHALVPVSPTLSAAAAHAVAPTALNPAAKPSASITAITPPKADVAKQTAMTQMLQSHAQTATQKAQKILALASKIKAPRMRSAMQHAGTVHGNKAQNAAIKQAHSAMGGFNVNQAFDYNAAEAAINAMIAQGSEDDALATLISDYNDLSSYVTQLQALNQTDIASSGSNLLTQMENLGTAYDSAGDSDPSLPSKVAVLDAAYNKWLVGPNGSGGQGSASYALNQSAAPTGSPNAPGATTPGATAAGAPTITSIVDQTTGTPNAGAPGDTVMITGTNFTGVSAVLFGGMPAVPFTVISPTQMTALIPQQAASGNVQVMSAAGTGTSTVPFTVSPAGGLPTGGGGGYGGGGGGGGGGYDGGGGMDAGGYDDGGGYDDSGDGGDVSADDGSDGGGAAYDPSSVMQDPYGDDFNADDDGSTDDGTDDGSGDDTADDGADFDNPFSLMGHGGHGHGGHNGHNGHRNGARGSWYAGPVFDVDGLELIDAVDVDDADREEVINDIVEQVTKRLQDKSTLIGEYNIQAAQRQMNTLKQVTVAIARAMVKGGQKVASETIASAEGGWLQKELPGVTSLKNTQGHLQWHADALAKLSDPTAVYASSNDVKKWCMQAFIDANAVEEGRARQEQIWSDMWTEIGAALAALPAAVAKTIVSLPGKAFEAITGIPSWIFWVGGAAVFVLLGVGAWKLLKIATPVATRVAAQRYLP